MSSDTTFNEQIMLRVITLKVIFVHRIGRKDTSTFNVKTLTWARPENVVSRARLVSMCSLVVPRSNFNLPGGHIVSNK